MKKNINFYKHDIAPDNTWLNKEYLIQLNLTGKCPRNCDFCYMKKYKNSFLSSSKIKKLWENLRKYNEAYGIEYRVNLTGGDIFEHPECQKIIKFISEESSITAVDPLINKIWTKKQYQILELIKDKINFIQLNSDLVTEKDLLEIKKLGKEIILKIAIYGGDFKSKVKKIKELSEKFDNIIVSIDLIIPQKGNTIKKSNFLIFDKERLKKRISKLKKVFGDKLWLLSTPIKREILKEIYFLKPI